MCWGLAQSTTAGAFQLHGGQKKQETNVIPGGTWGLLAYGELCSLDDLNRLNYGRDLGRTVTEVTECCWVSASSYFVSDCSWVHCEMTH